MLVLVAAVLCGLAVGAVMLAVVHPTRPLAPRLDPYAQRARRKLGQTVDPSLLFAPSRPERTSVFGPLLTTAARTLSRLVDATDTATLRGRLRSAGWDMTTEQYRMRQLIHTVQGAALFAAGGYLLMPTAAGVLAGAGLGAVWGASRSRARLEKAIVARCEQQRAELVPIGELLAMEISIGTAPVVAVERLARDTRGAVADDLTDAVASIRDGTKPQAAFDRLADRTVEPAAARFYRQLATDTGDAATLTRSLLAAVRDLRIAQREEIARLATRRRFSMLLPTVLVMGPVMLLFLAAPLPHLIFGDL